MVWASSVWGIGYFPSILNVPYCWFPKVLYPCSACSLLGMRRLQCWIPNLPTHGVLTFLTDFLISWSWAMGPLTALPYRLDWAQKLSFKILIFIFCPQHLWAGNSPVISCQLSSGAFSSKSPNEIFRVATQGLWLLQYAAEEVGPATCHSAVWGARGAIRRPEEHQPNCPEKVGKKMNWWLKCL